MEGEKKKVRLNRSVIQNTFPEILRGNKSKNEIGAVTHWSTSGQCDKWLFNNK